MVQEAERILGSWCFLVERSGKNVNLTRKKIKFRTAFIVKLPMDLKSNKPRSCINHIVKLQLIPIYKVFNGCTL